MLQCVSLIYLPRARTVIKWQAKDWKTAVHFPASVGWTSHYHCTQTCSRTQSHIKDMWDWSVAHRPPDFTLITHSHGRISGHQLTQWSKALLKTLTVPQLVNKFPAFYGTQRFTTVHTTVSHLSLSWGRWIESTLSAFYNLHCNIILPSMITSHKWSLSHKVYPPKLCMLLYFLPYVPHDPSISSSLIW